MKKTLKIFFRRVLKDNNIKLSIILVSIIILLSTALLSMNVIGITYEYRIGDIATEDIRSPREIQYPIKTETEEKKKRMAEMIPTGTPIVTAIVNAARLSSTVAGSRSTRICRAGRL